MTRRVVELAAFSPDGDELGRWTCGDTPAAIVTELTMLDGHPAVAAYRARSEGFSIIVPGFGLVVPAFSEYDDPHQWLTASDVTDGDPASPPQSGPVVTVRAGRWQRGDTAALSPAIGRAAMYGRGRPWGTARVPSFRRWYERVRRFREGRRIRRRLNALERSGQW